MVSIFQLNAWNSYCSLLIGIFMNILLLFLSKKYSSTDLKDYRNYIKLLAFWDISILLTQTITQPLYVMDTDAISYIYIQGIAKFIPFLILRNIFFILYIISLNQEMATLSMQFVNRYLLFCHPNINKTFRYCILTTFLIEIAILSIAIGLIGTAENDIPSEEIPILIRLFSADELAATKISKRFDGKISIVRISNSIYLGHWIVCYLVIIFCYFRIRSFLKLNIIVPQKRKIIKQVSLNMLLQALLPVYGIILSLIGISSIIFGFQIPILNQLGILRFAPSNWLPFLNPLVTILTISEYRNALWKMLPQSSQRTVHITKVVAPPIFVANGRPLPPIKTTG